MNDAQAVIVARGDDAVARHRQGWPTAPAADQEPVGDVVFGTDGNSVPLQGQGWSAPEPGYCWAIGTQCALTLRRVTPACMRLEIELAPFAATPRLPGQRLVVRADGVPLGSLYLTDICIVAVVVRKVKLLITVSCDPRQPSHRPPNTSGAPSCRAIAHCCFVPSSTCQHQTVPPGEGVAKHRRDGGGFGAGVDRLARGLGILGPMGHQSPREQIEVARPGFRMQPHDRRRARWRHVPGRLEIRRWVHRAEKSAHRLGRQQGAVSSAHGPSLPAHGFAGKVMPA